MKIPGIDEYIYLDNYPEPIYCEVFDLNPIATLPSEYCFGIRIDMIAMIYYRDLLSVCNCIYVPSKSEWINISCFRFKKV